MNILITAPSLDPTKNVSGIATVVNTIIENNGGYRYFHYLLGRPDGTQNPLSWLIQTMKQLCLFPFFVKKNKIDVVHQNLPFDPKGLMREWIINGWCRLLKVPVILHIHGGVFLTEKTVNPFYVRLSQSLFNHSKRVLVLSEIEKQVLAEDYGFAEAVILHNSVNVAEYENKGKKINTQMPVFLFLGRIHESKGIEDIVLAFEKLRKQRAFKFILCGNGPLRDEMISACENILGKDFEYAGIVSGKDKIEIIKRADFFLLPSHFEGLPMALLETMAAGVIPIVTGDTSMKYVVEDGINGIWVNKSDPADLHKKISNILTDEPLCNRLSLKAKETIEKDYAINKSVENLNLIYNTIG